MSAADAVIPLSVVEEIETAINKLERLKRETPGPEWHALVDPGDRRTAAAWIIDAAEVEIRLVGDYQSGQIAYLIVALHRTIDAQILILRHAVEEYSPWNDVQSFITDDGLRLARSINEGDRS